GRGFRGHGPVLDELQMRTPMVIRWPGRPPARITHRTSHNDLAPTLVTELFGCANPPSDYASGHSLFSGVAWDWLIGAGYEDFAVIEPDRVTVVLGSGYEIRDNSYRLIPHPHLPSRPQAACDSRHEPLLSVRFRSPRPHPPTFR